VRLRLDSGDGAWFGFGSLNRRPQLRFVLMT
jgi:hypothetical protein